MIPVFTARVKKKDIMTSETTKAKAITKSRLGLVEEEPPPEILKIEVEERSGIKGAVIEYMTFNIVRVIKSYYGEYRSSGYGRLKLFVMPNLPYKD